MKVMLIDGNSLTYRAFFTLPTDMATASGQITNAVFGFTSMFINILKDHTPDGVLVTFDRPEPTFRHEANPEYKANRTAAPDILRQQMGLVREVLAALRSPSSTSAVGKRTTSIATLATRGEAAGHDVLIVTGDRDSYQLVHDPHIKVLYNRRGVSDYSLYDEAGIAEKTGVTPDLYPQYAALARRPERQPRRGPRGGGEDRGEADQRVRRARRDLRQRRQADPEAKGLARRARGQGAPQPRADDPAPRRPDRGRLRRAGHLAR